MKKSHLLGIVSLLLCNTNLLAEALNYDMVQLQASASAQIPNDTMTANLFSELTDADPQRLNRVLDRQLDEAVNISKSFPSVKLLLSGRESFPVYSSNNKLQGWRGRVSFNATSQDFSALSQLVGKLQSQYQLAGVGYSVSEGRKVSVEKEVMKSALKAFQGKAQSISETLSPGKQYKIVNLQVGQEMPGPMFERALMKTASAAPAADYSAVNAGETILTVMVSGSVQIQ